MARRTIEFMQWLVFLTLILHYNNLETHVILIDSYVILYLIWFNGLKLMNDQSRVPEPALLHYPQQGLSILIGWFSS